MSPEQKQRREAILQADDKNQYAVVELLSRSYVEEFPDDANVMLRRGRILAMLRRYDEADGAIEDAAGKASEAFMPMVWIIKANALQQRGHYSEAEECLVRASELLPEKERWWVLTKLASVTWRCGGLELAEQRFRNALATTAPQSDDHDETWSNLGGVLVALGRLEEAAQCYREALALSPDYEIAQFRLDDVELALKLQSEGN